VCHPGLSAGRPSVPAGVMVPWLAQTPVFAIPGSPPLQLAVAPRLASRNAAGDPDQAPATRRAGESGLAVGEDADLAAGPVMRKSLATGGAGAAGRDRPGSPARRPALISTARPLASWQLARDRPVTSRLAATGEQSGGDARPGQGRMRCRVRR
jgi:hypothetical protein